MNACFTDHLQTQPGLSDLRTHSGLPTNTVLHIKAHSDFGPWTIVQCCLPCLGCLYLGASSGTYYLTRYCRVGSATDVSGHKNTSSLMCTWLWPRCVQARSNGLAIKKKTSIKHLSLLKRHLAVLAERSTKTCLLSGFSRLSIV